MEQIYRDQPYTENVRQLMYMRLDQYSESDALTSLRFSATLD
jgi:hypothetical protein